MQNLLEDSGACGYVELCWHLSIAWVQLCVLAERLGITPSPPDTFGSNEQRFAQRFECFEILGAGMAFSQRQLRAELQPLHGAEPL